MSRRNNPVNKSVPAKPRPPVRDRIEAAASELFFMCGLRAVPVRHVAWRADTNSDAVVKYFGSHEGLVVRYLEQNAEGDGLFRAEIEADYPGDPEERLRGWLRAMAGAATDSLSQGCVLTSAAFELMLHKRHPAHRVIRKFKIAQRDDIARLCRVAGYERPEALASKLFMLAEGGELAALTTGADGPGVHFQEAAEALLASHPKTQRTSNVPEVSHA
jgi:AcrR family transcriptional regulator